MRAIEVNVVLVDDDGKQYVKTYSGDESEILVGLLGEVATAVLGWATRPLPPPDLRGPVLRKVTEVEGHVEDYDHVDSPYISDGKARTAIVDILPDETRKDCTPYRFRITVEAVRVPDPEKDAQRLCGLPEKKGGST